MRAVAAALENAELKHGLRVEVPNDEPAPLSLSLMIDRPGVNAIGGPRLADVDLTLVSLRHDVAVYSVCCFVED